MTAKCRLIFKIIHSQTGQENGVKSLVKIQLNLRHVSTLCCEIFDTCLTLRSQWLAFCSICLLKVLLNTDLLIFGSNLPYAGVGTVKISNIIVFKMTKPCCGLYVIVCLAYWFMSVSAMLGLVSLARS